MGGYDVQRVSNVTVRKRLVMTLLVGLVILFIISLIIAIISLGISIKSYKNYERAMNKLGEGKD